ncbi:MAG: PLDc N-terminal domain-containing protein [Nocardioidaceae bacterium]
MAKKKWSEMSPVQKRMIVVAAAAEAVVTTVAARDLAKRPPEQVRGPKLVWGLLLSVQPVGPIAYLVAGRR